MLSNAAQAVVRERRHEMPLERHHRERRRAVVIRYLGNLVSSLCLLACALFGLSGCPGSLDFDPGGGTGAGGSGGLQTSCAMSATVLGMCTACHNPGSKSAYANLDLMSDGPAQRLVGVAAATDANGLCGGKGNLLNRGTTPATGIFIDKISNKQTCGGAMPFGTDGLGATDLACLQAWANGLVQSVGP